MKYTYILSILILFLAVSCTDNFEEFNTDTKNPAVVNGEALFTNAQKEMSDQINNTNVNRNIFKLVSQHWTETTYTDEANYNLVNRNIPQNIWRYYFRRSLKDLDEAALVIEATPIVSVSEEDKAQQLQVKTNKLQIIELLNVFIYQRLVDINGMVPYSEALDIDNVYPKYEDGFEIYEDLIKRLDAALSNMDAGEASFGSADLFYEGNVAAWIKFANALKIRIGITIADSHPDLAKTLIEQSVENTFTSSDDDCIMKYMNASPNFNPMYEDLVLSGRHDFVPANTIVDAMHELNDPRMEAYFSDPIPFPFPLDEDDNPRDSVITEDVIDGLRIVLADGSIEYRKTPFTMSATADKDVTFIMGGQYGYTSPWTNHSHVAKRIETSTFEGFILTYNELMFYLAEAAEREIGVPMTAEEYYNEGIKTSFGFWEAEDVDSYLANPSVAYATAEGTWKEKIALQSWLASYTRGLLGYNTWRRLDYPIFNVPEMVESYNDIPVRFTFPVNEQTLNSANYKAASEAIGGDLVTSKIFWDKF